MRHGGVVSEMKWIIRPRQTGKTHDLIEWAEQEEPGGPLRYIVCMNRWEADRVRDIALDDDSEPRIRRPLHIREALDYSGPEALFAVDNADIVLQELLGWRIAVASMTGSRNEEHRIAKAMMDEAWDKYRKKQR